MELFGRGTGYYARLIQSNPSEDSIAALINRDVKNILDATKEKMEGRIKESPQITYSKITIQEGTDNLTADLFIDSASNIIQYLVSWGRLEFLMVSQNNAISDSIDKAFCTIRGIPLKDIGKEEVIEALPSTRYLAKDGVGTFFCSASDTAL